uniref:Uncharacterized protein n=1 Tax=Molossus molossus TaxID=27622 RepID=A0A7J8CRR4_MOLMO|nr:hypothetical protein HJG59_009764 [Molossus molossus]
MSALVPAELSFLLGHQKRSIMEARVAFQLLSEEELLLLPLPHEWALLPRTVEDTSIISTPELGARVFRWPTLAFTIVLFFKPPFFLLEMGLLDLVVFFPLIYFSPGAGLSISSGQIAWHITPIIACSLWKKTPASFVKVFWEVRMFNHLSTFFFSLKKEKKK